MTLLSWTIVITLIVLLLFTVFVAYRFYRKAVIYDTIFQFLSDDIYTNLLQFSKMSRTTVLSNDDQVQQAHRNMITMGKRLEEILVRMEEASGLRLRPPPPPGPPPSWTDE